MFYIYHTDNTNFTHTSTINTSHYIRDISWTPSGDILFVDHDNHEVIVKSQLNFEIKKTAMTDPCNLTLCADNTIYLSDWKNGVYQSTNNDISWSHLFETADKSKYWQVIKVETDYGVDYWTQEKFR